MPVVPITLTLRSRDLILKDWGLSDFLECHCKKKRKTSRSDYKRETPVLGQCSLRRRYCVVRERWIMQ